MLPRAPRPDFVAILAPRRGRWTSKIIEILATVFNFCGFAILSSSRVKKSIWDPLGPPLGDLWAPIWTPRAPRALPRWLQDHPRRLQDSSDGLQNRSKSPQEPLQEASKSPRPSKKRPRGAQGPSKSSQERSKSPPRTLKCQTAGLGLRVRRVGWAGTAKRIQSAAHLPVCFGVLDQ